MKVKDIKKKVEAKIAKGMKKIEKKCGKGAKASAVVVAAIGIAALLGGCLGTTQPSRSQNLAIRDSIINIYGTNGGMTNDVARVEIASQAMQIENSGSESQTATPTQTTDVKPDIDVTVPVNKANAGTSAAAGGALETVLQAGAEKLGSALRGASPAASPAEGASEACPGGNCSVPAAGGVTAAKAPFTPVLEDGSVACPTCTWGQAAK